MCTAASYIAGFHYFGRNLDLERSYGQTVTVTPRNMALPFRHAKTIQNHGAMIGMATVVNDYPLYFDATNESGLSMAGLNFPDNAYYGNAMDCAYNIAPFEFIPWILARCDDVEQARELIDCTNIINESFSQGLPNTPLHWIISDRDSSIVVESTESGMEVYDNPVGILTNNPPFPYHMTNLANYMGLTAGIPDNNMSQLGVSPYSRGMGAMGLPGDLSSASRFVRAVFTKTNSVSDDSEEDGLTQFFHILDSVQQPRGCCRLDGGQYEITVYSSCCNTDTGTYYFKTYGNNTIRGVDMHRCNLNSKHVIRFPLMDEQEILMLD